MNLCEGKLSTDQAGTWVHLGDQKLLLDPALVSQHKGLANASDGRVIVVGVRPEDMEDAAFADAPPERTLKSKVDITEALGSEVMVHFGMDAPQVYSDGNNKSDEELERIGVDSGATFVGSFNARSRIRPGDLIDVAVNTSHLHFFELATGERL